jgi:hypothetical protein
MNQRSTNTLQFRGIRERNLDDQVAAMEAGYNSVAEYAIDELARRLIALEQRVAELDGKEIAPLDPED